jgi:hypothetical protein
LNAGEQVEQPKPHLPPGLPGRLPRGIHVRSPPPRELLYNQQKTCEKTGKYLQAEAAKKRLTQVKEQLQAQRRADLLTRFEEEKRQVETAHLEEISEFNTYWDGKML